MHQHDLEYFYTHIRGGKPSRNTTCWVWGGLTSHGYGIMPVVGERQFKQAHRLAYEHFVGKIPPNRQLKNMCGNYACVNPQHWVVSGSDESLIKRFHRYCKPPNDDHQCWIWRGPVDTYGKPILQHKHKQLSAKRVAWEYYRGYLPTKRAKLVKHNCSNPLCVNPAHHRLMKLKSRKKTAGRQIAIVGRTLPLYSGYYEQ